MSIDLHLNLQDLNIEIHEYCSSNNHAAKFLISKRILYFCFENFVDPVNY